MSHPMDRARWEKVIGKFKKNELLEVAEDLGFEGLFPSNPARSSKKELVAIIVDKCLEVKIPNSRLLAVELSQFCQGNSTALWRVYKLDYADPSSGIVSDAYSRAFKKKLHFYLSVAFDYEMVQNLESSGIWLCLHISDRSLLPYTCFVVRYPPSPFIFVTGVRKTHLIPLMEALCLTLDSNTWTFMDIAGKDLQSVRSLVCDQYSQGPRSSYRLNKVDRNPLMGASRRALPTTHPSRGEKEEEEEEEEEEAGRRAKKCKLAADEAFGTNPLPTIENFTFKLCADLPDKSDAITCKLKFSGANVFEGMKAAIAADCFTLPIPEAISKVTSLASTTVTLDTRE